MRLVELGLLVALACVLFWAWSVWRSKSTRVPLSDAHDSERMRRHDQRAERSDQLSSTIFIGAVVAFLCLIGLMLLLAFSFTPLGD